MVSVGSEATLFVKGIVAGSTITKRLATVFRDAPAKARYAAEALLRPGKPLAVTEFGMRPMTVPPARGAGFGVVGNRSLLLHQLPLVDRLVRVRLNGGS